MSNTIRTFIAISVSSELKQIIEQAQNFLKKLDTNVSWVKPENAHLTLKFLGDVKPKRIIQLSRVMENLFSNHEPITTGLTCLGAFPNADHPKILWIGLEDVQGRLANLANSLDDELGKIGLKKETVPFFPHITIGRLRSPKNISLLTKAMREIPLPTDHVEVLDHSILYKSTLTSQGPIHESLFETYFSQSKP